HLHVHAIPRDLDVATQHVGNHAHAFARHFHADHVRFASGQTARHFFGRQQQRTAVLSRGFATGHLLGTHLVQLFGGAEAWEGVAHFYQLLAILLVNIAALTLPVRTVRSTDIRAFAPVDTQPAQGVEDLLFGFARGTQLVGVFDPQ